MKIKNVVHDLTLRYMDLYSKPYERKPDDDDEQVVHRFMSEYVRVFGMIEGWSDNTDLEKILNL